MNHSLRGKQARCPRCREVIRVPDPNRPSSGDVAGEQFCDRCNRPVLPHEMSRDVEGKFTCSYCLTDLGLADEASAHDPTGLGIPGMVVLRGGKEEREAARRFLDRKAQEQHDSDRLDPESGEEPPP